MGKKFSLAACRVNANMTQGEVAKRIGRCKSTLVKWEHYDTKIPSNALFALAELYDVPVEDIFLPYVSTTGENNQQAVNV